MSDFETILKRGKIPEAVREMNKYHSIREELRNIRFLLEQKMVEGSEELELKKEKLDQLVLSNSKAKAKRDEAIEELTESEIKARKESESAGKLVSRVLKKKEEYEEKDAEQAKRKLETVSELQSRESVAKSRYETLIGEFKELEEEHSKRKDKLQLAHDALVQSKKGEIAEIKLRLVQLNSDQKVEENKLEQEKLIDISRINSQRAEKRTELAQNLATLEERLKHSFKTPEEDAIISSRTDQRDGLINEQNGQQEEFNRIRQEKGGAKGKLDDLVRQYEDQHESVKGLKSRKQQLLKDYNPKDSTFLSALKQSDPAWSETVSKVISGELLHRTDLSPELIEQAEKLLYGWDLDLSRIELPDFAQSDEWLREAIDRLERKIINEKEVRETWNQSVEKQRADLKGLEEAYELQKTTLAQVSGNLTAANEALAIYLSDVDALVAERKKQEKQEADDLASKIDKFDIETKLLISAVADQYRESQNNVIGNFGIQIGDQESRKQSITDEITSAEKQHKLDIRQAEDDYFQLLSENGVDEEIVKTADSERQKLKEELQSVENSRPFVREYTEWLEAVWSNLNQYESDARDANSTHQDFYSQLEQAKKEHRNKRTREKKKVSAAQEEIKSLADLTEELSRISAALERENVPAEEPINPLVQDVDTLKQRVDTLLHDNHKQSRKLVQLSRGATLIIKECQTKAIKDAWSAHSRELLAELNKTAKGDVTEFDEQYFHQAPIALSQFMGEDLEKIEDLFSEQVAETAMSLHELFGGLKLISDEIKAQSSSLSAAISGDVEFKALEGVRVELKPRIDQQEFWGILKQFSKKWEQQQQSDRRIATPKFSEYEPRFIELLSETQRMISQAKISDSLDTHFDLVIHLKENGHERVIRSDADINGSSSKGITYLALCVLFAGVVRMIRKDMGIRIHWPVDEIGILHSDNFKALLRMLDKEGITMVGAFPDPDPAKLRYFDRLYNVITDFGVEILIPKPMPRSDL